MDPKLKKILEDFSVAIQEYEAEGNMIPDEVDDIWLLVTYQLQEEGNKTNNE